MDFSEQRVFITGINGFAGSFLARYLVEKGAEVHGLVKDNVGADPLANLKHLGIKDDLELVYGDINEKDFLQRKMVDVEPEHVFHFAAKTYVPYSFSHPQEVFDVNTKGTLNMLEIIRSTGLDTSFVFAGSSEEYGLVFSSQDQYKRLGGTHEICPEPGEIPELPVSEKNPLRPRSPYAVSKMCADRLTQNYYDFSGIDTKVSRAFNHEGSLRGERFVTSTITSQVARLRWGNSDEIMIGNVNAFRDWSHVEDIVRGYCLLSSEGRSGSVYNQGSERTNSVLSYILLSLEEAGYSVESIRSLKNGKKVENPVSPDDKSFFGRDFFHTKIDRMLLENSIRFDRQDEGIRVECSEEDVVIRFKKDRFRPSEVPILMSDTGRMRDLGFSIDHSISDIIDDQLGYFRNKYS